MKSTFKILLSVENLSEAFENTRMRVKLLGQHLNVSENTVRYFASADLDCRTGRFSRQVRYTLNLLKNKFLLHSI